MTRCQVKAEKFQFAATTLVRSKKLWFNKSAAVYTLEVQSAGLSSVGTYFQLLTRKISCLFATWLVTNVFQFLG